MAKCGSFPDRLGLALHPGDHNLLEETLMKQITEEMHLEKEWFAEAKKQTLRTLPKFLRKLAKYNHDYGTICHALSAGAVGATYALNRSKHGGITGFQAGFVMWGFIRQWYKNQNKTGMRLVDYDNMLYPQYEKNFDKIIDPEHWEALQKEAKTQLETETNAHPAVIEHWQKIVNGEIPFGYRVEES